MSLGQECFTEVMKVARFVILFLLTLSVCRLSSGGIFTLDVNLQRERERENKFSEKENEKGDHMSMKRR